MPRRIVETVYIHNLLYYLHIGASDTSISNTYEEAVLPNGVVIIIRVSVQDVSIVPENKAL